jgi:hypothetical protein
MAPKPDVDLPIDPKMKESIESRLEKIGLDTKSPKFELESFMRWSENYDGGMCRSLDALIESGYRSDNFWGIAKVVGKVSKAGPENYLQVFKNLKEKLSYDGVRTEVYSRGGQVDNLLQLARFKAFDVNMLAETGYALTKIDGKNILMIQDVNVISMLMNRDLTRYSEILKKFKEAAGCKGKFYYNSCHAEDILALSNTNDDLFGAIDALVKSGCKPMFYNNGILPYASLIKEIAAKGPDRYLAVFTKLKELGYKILDKHNSSYNELEKIIQILNIKGDVLKILDVLAETNYKIHHFFNHPHTGDLTHYEIELIKSLVKLDLEKFVKCYKFLKDRFGVSTLNDTTADSVLRLSQLGDESFKAMNTLADSGYVLEKIGKNRWMTYEDVNLVKKLSNPKNLEAFLQNLYKLKEILGYDTVTMNNNGKRITIDFSKLKYLATHANEILQISEMKGDVWGAIDALVKSGYKIDFSNKKLFSNASLVERLAKRDISKYLAIFNKLKEKFDYKTVNLGDEPGNQVDGLIDLAQTKGDVCKAIDALAESGYKLATLYRKAWVCYHDASAIRAVAMNGPENYLKVFKKLKEKLGYNTVRAAESKGGLNDLSYEQVQKIIEISQIPGNVCEIINTLAEWRNLDVNAHGKDNSLHAGGLRIDEKKLDMLSHFERDFKKYKIDKKKGITDKDVQIINHISNELWKKTLENIIPCFYSFPRTFYKENLQYFIECFKSLSAEEKKKALKGVFNCKKVTNEEVTRWLDENEPELVREVGIGLI